MLKIGNRIGGGIPRPITQYGDPVLTTPCDPVTEFGYALEDLIADMFASMDLAGGVGLAANQIGIPLRVFVLDCPDDGQGRLTGHIINPSFTILDDTPLQDFEGCLSVSGPIATLPRPAVAEVRGVDYEGNEIHLIGRGMAARCLQHETDHLNGRLYIENLPEFVRRSYVPSAT